MIRAVLIAALAILGFSAAPGAAQDLQTLLQTHQEEVREPSRRGVGVVLEDLLASDLPGVPLFLDRWQNRQVWVRASDGLFFYTERADGGVTLLDIASGEPVGTAALSEVTEIRPNGGVRREIASALVRFQLSDPDIAARRAALAAIARSPSAEQIEPLTGSIEDEPDPDLRLQKTRLASLLTARFGDTTEARIGAIDELSDDISVDVRAVLNQILTASPAVATAIPEGTNVLRVLEPGSAEFSEDQAYDRLVAAGLAQARVSPESIREALAANIEDGFAGGVPIAQLDTDANRETAYAALAAEGLVPPFVPAADRAAAVAAHVFYEAYAEANSEITDAARDALEEIETRVGVYQAADLTLDALSLASIYFLAAIGLAITFGVMGVINMAHGEFIMMGAYTGYVVQLFIPDYTLSILVALPLAFTVTFGAGVAMERLVIRWLYHRPLETLLATFGISIALQQIAKNVFGTQARPLTSPAWLDGAWVLNDVVQISYIRIAIFVLAIIFLGLILFILKRTRIGLEVRAVTQNPGMAASMGINPDRINMLTFGLGSGIAGIAGVAIGLYAKVTSEMGADYIVQSFMTVVVGGVGNVWGTLAGATLIGFLQKGIEWFNPSNTLAAQTYMILFIILFIQFRPKGIVALKGRAAGD